METNGSIDPQWRFKGNEELNRAAISVRGVTNLLKNNLNKDDDRLVISIASGDPTEYHCFRTASFAVEAIVSAVNTFNFNSYSPTVGVLEARKAIAEYLSSDLSYKLSPDDVFLTVGCTQAIEIIISVLARPGANILLPKPGYPQYEARAAFDGLEVRHFRLLPESNWEVDIDSLEALADENTAAMVIINPSNPCGNVFTYKHLKKIAEMARKLGIFVISDEVYGRLAFGSNPFVPMGIFGSIVPVLTLGSISKRWVVPGWRFGWIVTTDPNGLLKKSGIVESIKNYLDITADPPTFIQGAIPQILAKADDGFFSDILDIMREDANILYEKIKEIPCLTCLNKPQGSMVVMVKLNLELLEGIKDDVDFCLKLAKEESVIVLPGVTFGAKNWLRVTFSIEPSTLAESLDRIKAFDQRHAKKQ